MNPVLLYPFILFAGALQAAGNSMNAKLRSALVNPWLAATISFSLICFVFVFLFMVMPTPLPTIEKLEQMRWWGPFGGLAGAVAVFGGLAMVDKVGAGPFNGLLITANILTSLAIDNFGWFGMQAHTQSLTHMGGAALMVGGIVLIANIERSKPMDTSKLLYPFILVAGALQAIGVTMNAALNYDLVNPWLAAAISFIPIVFVFITVLVMRPLPLPTQKDVATMPWWAPLGGITGAVAVFGGLLFVQKVGAGPFNGLLITANLLTSLAIDHFGLIYMPVHKAGKERLIGAALMVAGIVMIAFF